MAFRRTYQKTGRSTEFMPAFAKQKSDDADNDPTPESAVEQSIPAPTTTETTTALSSTLQLANETISEQAQTIATLQSDIDLLTPILDALPELRQTIARQAATDIGQILSALTRRIVGESLALNPDALPHIVQQALNAIPGDDEVWLTVPTGTSERIAKLFANGRPLHIQTSDDLTAGCRVSTKNAHLDVTVDAALESIDAAIKEWVDSDPCHGANE